MFLTCRPKTNVKGQGSADQRDDACSRTEYERMTMSGYEKLVLTLPNEAAAKLKELAEQENKTVAAFVANVLDDWLEKRRRDVRLGRTIQQATLLEVGKVTGTGRRR
jgi:hypothetical protein